MIKIHFEHLLKKVYFEHLKRGMKLKTLPVHRKESCGTSNTIFDCKTSGLQKLGNELKKNRVLSMVE